MTSRRLKTLSLLAGLFLSALTLFAWTGQWYTFTLRDSATGNPSLSVSGEVAAPALLSLALAGLALVGALTIAGPVFRAALGAFWAVIGCTVVFTAVQAQLEPVRAAQSAVSAVTGVGGAKSVAAEVVGVATTGYPVLAIAAGVVTVMLGAVVIATGRRWPGPADRYRHPAVSELAAEPETSDSSATAVSDWDRLSGGSDPTGR